MNELRIAGLIDHALLHPTMTDDALLAGCDVAARYEVATVCVKPCWIATAVKHLENSPVGVGTVIGFPHGVNHTRTKVFEANQACDDGAVELDMVANVGKALSGEWSEVADDIAAVVEAARRRDALVKVIIETDYQPDDATKIRFCEVVTQAGANFIKTSTGFGFVKQESGDLNYVGATAHDVELMRQHCGANVDVKASGGIRSFADAQHLVMLGATRLGTSATEAIVRQSGSGDSY